MIRHRLRGASLAVVACALALSACATDGQTPGAADQAATPHERHPLFTGLDYATNLDPYPSTYQPLPRRTWPSSAVRS